MHQDLQKSFSDYGVYIEQVNIMNVIMPRDLREFLMHTTNYDVYLQKQVKEQGYKMLKINNDENKKLLQLKRDNFQKLMTKQHEIDVAEIELIQQKIELETNLIIKEINSNKNQSIKLINAHNILKLAKLRSEAVATTAIKKAEAHRDQKHKDADNNAEIIEANAATRLGVAKSKAQALIKEANSELTNSAKVDPMRRHQEKMTLASSLDHISSNGKMVVAGANGQSILNFYNDTMNEVGAR